MSNKNMLNLRDNCVLTLENKLIKQEIKDEPLTPVHGFSDFDWATFESDLIPLRKSLSMSDVASLNVNVHNNWQLNDDTAINGKSRKTNGTHELSRQKFVSTAEAIYHYERDIPDRFHSIGSKIFNAHVSPKPSGLTVPQSPMLRCKMRSRPIHFLSQKQIEEIEIEEMKKFKIKAKPIPKSVKVGPLNLPDIPKRPVTVPEPFKLTEAQQKLAFSSEEIHSFKARPAPKHILEKPQIPPKVSVQRTNPLCSKITKPSQPQHNGLESHIKKSTLGCEEKHQRQGPILPEPFSFEKRNELMKRKKEEWIKKQIEEEKRQASLFKAQPLPIAVKKQMQSISNKISTSSTTSSENKENLVKFEAKSPRVLYKPPFKPVLEPLQHTQLAPFDLNTEKRAAEREQFDKFLKQKEEEEQRLREEMEKVRMEEEKRSQAVLRAKLVHHAKPVPHIRPFIPEKSSIPLTEPETPNFIRRLKRTNISQ